MTKGTAAGILEGIRSQPQDAEAQPLLNTKKNSLTQGPDLEKCDKNSEKQWGQHIMWLSTQFGSVFIFVFLGAGQALATRASIGPDGVLPYDTSAAVTLAELIKLTVSIVCLLTYERQNMQWSFPTHWKYETADLGVVAVLFATTNELNFYIVQYLGAALFMMLGNLKIVWTCFFMWSILGKRFLPLQWLAVCLMTASAIVVKLPQFMDMGTRGQQTSVLRATTMGLLLTLISTAASGLASVKNEQILKKNEGADVAPMPFMAKNAVLYIWGVCLNSFAWGLWGKYSFSACITNKLALLSILCLVGLGLACAVMLRYLDNVARCFGSVAQVLVTVVLSQTLPTQFHEGHLGKSFAVSLTMLAVALVLYQAHSSKNLPIFIVFAVFITMGALGLGHHFGGTI